MTPLEDGLKIVGIIAGAIGSMFGIAKGWGAIKSFFAYLKKVKQSTDVFLDLPNQIVEVRKEIADIKKETRTNGGSSMRDEIKHIQENTLAIKDQLTINCNLQASVLYLDKDPIAQTDVDGKCNFVNQAYMNLTGFTDPQEAYGLGWKRAIDPRDVKRVQEEWMEAVRTNTQFVSEYRHKHVRTGDITPVRTRTHYIHNSEGEVFTRIAVMEILPINKEVIKKFYSDDEDETIDTHN